LTPPRKPARRPTPRDGSFAYDSPKPRFSDSRSNCLRDGHAILPRHPGEGFAPWSVGSYGRNIAADKCEQTTILSCPFFCRNFSAIKCAAWMRLNRERAWHIPRRLGYC
jgi:hypothetical protein